MIILVVPLVATAALAFLAGRIHADEWALYVIARIRGGVWFVSRRKCPGCGWLVHIMRERDDALAATEAPGGDGYFCLMCASGRPR